MSFSAELKSVDEALAALLPGVTPVSVETASLDGCGGRVLAQQVVADRDSPALNVSAMDGFAVRAEELATGPLRIEGECPIGQPPRELSPGAALRIFTGSPVPVGADAVLKVEDALVEGDTLRAATGVAIAPGEHFRCRGENGRAGRVLLEPGALLTPAAVTTVASVLASHVAVRRQVRVRVLVTGNELLVAGEESSNAPPPWRLRDSNGPTLRAQLSGVRWVEALPLMHVADDPQAIRAALHAALEEADAVVLTGGVSKGDHDHVPACVRAIGAEVRFHGVAIRPGRPALGAVLEGKPILALPGNPMSVAVTAVRLLGPALRRRAGMTIATPETPVTRLNDAGDKILPLEWHRPVRLSADGSASLVMLCGSGDVFGAAASDGFVAIPPGVAGPGPYRFFRWSL